MDIYEYVEEYGSYTFEEMEFNEVDNLIFSLLTYLDYKDIVSRGKDYKRLEDIGVEYLFSHKRRDVEKLGVAMSDAYKLLTMIIKTNRYKDILVHHYVYISSIDTQFSALTFKINKKLKYIAFEGTDELISGWKEDAIMSYKFPVEAHTYAIKYINKEISLFDKTIIVGGHSKGGNLALVSSMYTRSLKKKKISKIYSNDGPGLRLTEFYSDEYKSIKDRYRHIIPAYSVVGTLLNNDEYLVIKSSRKDIMAHSAATWLIDETSFIRDTQSDISKRIESELNEWINNQTDGDKKEFLEALFGKFEELGIKDLTQVKDIRVIINIIREMRDLDKKYRDLLVEIIKLIVKCYIK